MRARDPAAHRPRRSRHPRPLASTAGRVSCRARSARCPRRRHARRSRGASGRTACCSRPPTASPRWSRSTWPSSSSATTGSAPARLLVVPIVIVASKLMGLYDRDELVLRKTTLDEAPALLPARDALRAARLAARRALVVDGDARPRPGPRALGLLFVCLLARPHARARASRAGDAPAERCLVVGDADAPHRVIREAQETRRAMSATSSGAMPLDGPARPHRRRWPTLEQAIVASATSHRVILAPERTDSDEIARRDPRSSRALGVQRQRAAAHLRGRRARRSSSTTSTACTLLGVRRFGLVALLARRQARDRHRRLGRAGPGRPRAADHRDRDRRRRRLAADPSSSARRASAATASRFRCSSSARWSTAPTP